MGENTDHLVLLLCKGAQPEGRLCPKKFRRFQNWYTASKKAAEIAKALNPQDPEVLILSAVEVSNPPGYEIHAGELERRGIRVRHQPSACETIGELEEGFEIAKEEGKKLHVIISGVCHYIRIRWLIYYGLKHGLLPDISFELRWTWGLPRRNQIVTAIPGIFLMVGVDLLGKREEFKQRMESRRADSQ